ncbi:hypothetical protein Q8A73_007070 [Channa argus]|nr:hypothetical protein Q8A73_007070 [Channa argus]
MSIEQNGATVSKAYVPHVQREQHSLLQKQIKPSGFKHDSKAGGCEVDEMKRNIQVHMSSVSLKSISADRWYVQYVAETPTNTEMSESTFRVLARQNKCCLPRLLTGFSVHRVISECASSHIDSCGPQGGECTGGEGHEQDKIPERLESSLVEWRRSSIGESENVSSNVEETI